MDESLIQNVLTKESSQNVAEKEA